ncbi:MAG: phosphatase PAP2 family protein, partial [Opitutaceae bacterium]|nr:phosphatase PAP2 family protein [Opitutaceae bacterium]
DSPAGLADLETVLQIQADRTPAQVGRARRGSRSSIALAILADATGNPALGEKENLPQTSALLDTLAAGFAPHVNTQKNKWNRPRPHRRDPAVNPCVRKHDSASYPSGHSGLAAFRAEILSAALPEYKTQLAAAAREIAWSRVLGGIHFPSDTQAGLLLGRLVAGEMLKTPSTQSAVAEMRAEIQSLMQKPSNPAAPR